MIGLRFVLDTNVIISAALQPEGLERTALLIASTKPATLYVSEAILSEYREVLNRRKFRLFRGERNRLLQYIRNCARVIKPKTTLRIAGYVTDNKFLECAEASRADYFVTGNLKHFPRYWKSTKTATARELLEILAPHRPL